MLQFEQVTQPHLSQLLEFIELYYKDDHLEFDYDKAHKGLVELIETPHYGEVWLVSKNQKYIGYILIAFGFSLECGGKEAFVDELFILKEMRGQGYGTKAIQYAFERCKINHIHALRLEVTKGNDSALKLYKNIGFEDLGRSLLVKWIT